MAVLLNARSGIVFVLALGAFFLLPSFVDATVDVYDTPGSYQWTAPAGVTSAIVACWGGGADGLYSGGGGGGAFASSTVAVTPGNMYDVVVGGGGANGGYGATSTFNGSSVVAAPGWGSVNPVFTTTIGGRGGAVASSTGDTKYAGGNGGNSGNPQVGDSSGGGGGGAGGPHGAGQNGTNGGQNFGGSGGAGNAGLGGAGGNGAFEDFFEPENSANATPAGSSVLGGGGGGGYANAFTASAGGTYGGGGGGSTDGADGACTITFEGGGTGFLSKPPNNLGLVGYWSFNEGQGINATDFSGNGHHGTLLTFANPATSASGWTSQGKRAGALHFDGNNDEVTTADINATDAVQNMSISVWLKADTLLDWANIVSKYNSTNGWVFETGGSGSCGDLNDMAFYPDTGGAGDCVHTDNNAHEAGVWEHWVLTFDGTITDDLDSVDFYKNGVEITVEDQSAGIGNTTDNNAVIVTIGGDDTIGGPDDEFDGIIDEVRIYNRTLTQGEITALYQASAARLISSTKNLQTGSTLGTGLVEHFTFDGADFTNFVADVSGSANHGFLFNTATTTMRINGILGQAMQFDGSDDTVRSVDVNATDSASQLTLSAWIKPGALADWTPFISKCDCDGGTANWNFGMSNAGNGSNNDLSFFPDGQSGAYTTSNILTTGVWQHVAVVYDGTQADASKITFYHNGVAYAETLFENPSLPATTASNAIRIGLGQHGGTTGDPYYNGSMDDARVYTRALSATEIKQLYQLGRAVITP